MMGNAALKAGVNILVDFGQEEEGVEGCVKEVLEGTFGAEPVHAWGRLLMLLLLLLLLMPFVLLPAWGNLHLHPRCIAHLPGVLGFPGLAGCRAQRPAGLALTADRVAPAAFKGRSTDSRPAACPTQRLTRF